MDKPYLRDESVSCNTITRRRAIAAATAAAIITTSAHSATVVDPLPIWLEEWRNVDVRYWVADDHDPGFPELEAEWERLTRRMIDARAQSTDGLIAKLDFFLQAHDQNRDGFINAEAEKALFTEVREFVEALS